MNLTKYRTTNGGDPLSRLRIRNFQSDVCDDSTGKPVTCPVFWLGDQFAVTAYGLEALDGSTSVTLQQLQGRDVAGDIAAGLVDTTDFEAAIDYIRRKYKRTYLPVYL